MQLSQQLVEFLIQKGLSLHEITQIRTVKIKSPIVKTYKFIDFYEKCFYVYNFFGRQICVLVKDIEKVEYNGKKTLTIHI